jgi:hypothetical protein
MAQQDTEFKFHGNHFQPSNCEHNSMSKFEISFHTSSLCLVEDFLLLEQRASSMIVDVNDVFHGDLPLEMHIIDVLQVNDGLSCTFSRPYFSPLQQWIELACART